MPPTESPDNRPQPLVHVVDDDAGARDALEALFASVSLPVRFYASPRDYLDECPFDGPGCLVVDLRMPEMSGLELQRSLVHDGFDLPIIFLTGHGNMNAAVRAMRAGAVDFLTKPVDDEALLQAVREALRRSEDAHGIAEQRQAARERLDGLTERERDVLEGVVDGRSSKEIARDLGISYRTVELHRSHILEKTETHSIAELVQLRMAATGEEPAAG